MFQNTFQWWYQVLLNEQNRLNGNITPSQVVRNLDRVLQRQEKPSTVDTSQVLVSKKNVV